MMNIQNMTSPAEIERCFEAFLELRPHLKDKKSFLNQILLQQKEGYQIIAIREKEEIASVIGYRLLTTLAWGKILYIDDLMTRECYRGKGYGAILLKEALTVAQRVGCKQVHLDTGYTRSKAHKLYLNHGFELNCHHLALSLPPSALE